MKIFTALSSTPETYDLSVHKREDLFVVSGTLTHQNDERGRFPVFNLTVENTRQALDGKWIHVTRGDTHIFHGQVSLAPRGFVDHLIDIEVVAEPENAPALLRALLETQKNQPDYDPLFIPQGEEDNPAEILAGSGKVIAWPRIAGSPILCDPISGSKTLEIVPNVDTLDVQQVEYPPSKIEVSLSAEWIQLVSETFDLSSDVGRIETLTHTEMKQNWPLVGSSIGSMRVTRSELRERDRDAETLTPNVAADIGDLEFDPAWFEGGPVVIDGESKVFDATLRLENRFDLKRTETVRFSVESQIQPLIRSEDVEILDVPLNDIVERSSASLWRPFTDYEEGDEFVDGAFVYRVIEAHNSGSVRDRGLSIQVGETSYLSSRRVNSFFRTERGQQAIQHALNRAKARLTFASRCIEVSCEAPLPDDLNSIDHDTLATILSDDLIAGEATGRVVDYTMHFGDTEYLELTIACTAGTGGSSVPQIGDLTGSVPFVGGRVEVSVENTLDDQLPGFLSADTVPETHIQITTTPAPATDIQQEAEVEIQGTLSLPQQIEMI